MSAISGSCSEPSEAPAASAAAVTPLAFFPQMQLSSVFRPPLFISAASSRVSGSAGQRPSPGCPQASPSLSSSPFRRNRCSPSRESFPPGQHGPAGARSSSNGSCSAPRAGRPWAPGRSLPTPAAPRTSSSRETSPLRLKTWFFFFFFNT